MVKRVLMVAFHYPPLQGGSGIQRTLAFSRHLPACGWEPLVLTVTPGAHASLEPGGADQDGCIVHRTRALDASRHLAIKGRYPDLLAMPDRWATWLISAVPAGLRLIRRYRPDLIWSTYPIATAHLVALALHRASGLPWIADQRDPMLDDGYPTDARRRRQHAWIEQRVMGCCAAVVCTTPGAVAALRERHPRRTRCQVRLIENGYDEDAFYNAEKLPASNTQAGQPFRLLHSGVIYPSERDPAPLFTALARLLNCGEIRPTTFRLVLRASGHDDHLRDMLARHPGLSSLVELAPPLRYPAALREMLDADALLLLQAANCNAQIPAKFYEYLRAQRPILALTDAAGDSAAALRHAGLGTIAPLDDAEKIAIALRRFVALCRQGQAPLASAQTVADHARSARTRELAALFDATHHKELQ
ncbi:glycosyltransferase [Duganella sp. Leaf61]|uniref:glycosyltransferase n=1 Tax=Duganella sp. Leaf61 TaxID=1736227 RepID=UPI0006FF00E6|nr:glycosyltransferase [Duganella sp. Leaf61]KQN69399.1 glycosyltransferase [Duganella sp. Leaf61]